MQPAKFCAQCGAALLPDNPVCPRCAFQVAMGPFTHGNVEPTLGASDRSSRGSFVPPKPEQIAQHFPQLEILDLIGQGGMGAVYKARQRGLDRLVALKILPPEVGNDPAFQERFKREGKALARLNHPNIVAVYDSNEAGGLFYFIMEYVDGVDLRQAISNGHLSPKEALAIVPQICDALQYAHDEGIVHRDIKPENVLIDAKGRVKIADFGLARLLRKSDDSYTLTGDYQIMGTPKYMAPEQLERTHEVDHRADIYSLGVVFYEMLTGELPLGRFAPPSKKVQVDVRLDEVVLRTLEKEPSLRFQQASEIKSAVQTIVGPAIPSVLSNTGREYRSQTEFLGLPLFHYATGIDPHTGKLRVAKGVIAVGNQAYGGLAIGGFACGLISIGGVAMGGLTLGGVSMGLALAIGGFALGTGAALGGFAAAPVAIGGCAIGYYGAGGAAFAVHPFGANARDDAAVAFFRSAGHILLYTLPLLGFVGLAGLAIVLLLYLVRAMAKVLGLGQARTQYPPDGKPSSRTFDGLAIGAILLFFFVGLVAVPGAALFYLWRGMNAEEAIVHQRAEAQRQRARAAVAAAEAEMKARAVVSPARHELLNWTDRGPSLSDALRQRLRMDVVQGGKVDPVLQEIHQAYREIEKRHMKREGESSPGTTVEIPAGKNAEKPLAETTLNSVRQVVTIHMPQSEIDRLEQQLWDGLDPLLTAEQQAIARKELPVTSIRREDLKVGSTADDVTMPGILGWGSNHVRIEIFRGGEWFEWTVTSQEMSQTRSMRGLDPRVKRFWAGE